MIIFYFTYLKTLMSSLINIKTPQLVILTFLPRACSSILYRVLMNFPKSVGYFEDICKIIGIENNFFKAEEKKINTTQDLLESIDIQMKRPREEVEFIVIKDSILYFLAKPELMKGLEKYNPKIICMFRSPKKISDSFNNAVNKSIDRFPDSHFSTKLDGITMF